MLARRILFKLPVLSSLDPEVINLKRRLNVWHKIVIQLCDEREASKVNGNESLPNDCLQALIDANLTRQQICDHLTTIVVAGFETTANLVALAAYRIARFPEVQAKLKSEIRQVLGTRTTIEAGDLQKLCFLQCILKETMRLSPIIPVVTRDCNSHFGLTVMHDEKERTITIPKGCSLLIPYLVTHRDEEIWDDAHKFIPGNVFKGLLILLVWCCCPWCYRETNTRYSFFITDVVH